MDSSSQQSARDSCFLPVVCVGLQLHITTQPVLVPAASVSAGREGGGEGGGGREGVRGGKE